jgi:hypothetical protein
MKDKPRTIRGEKNIKNLKKVKEQGVMNITSVKTF